MPDPGSPQGAADRPESWPVPSSQDLFRDEWVMALRADMVSRPGHEEQFRRLVLEHPGSVIVLAVDDEQRVLVLHQYRHAVGTRMVELPAGLCDVAGEDPLVTAKRELHEEAGLEADGWSHLLTFRPSPGISSEVMHVFVATGLSTSRLEGFEAVHEEADMTTAWVPLDELVDAVLASRVSNGPLGLAVLSYARRNGHL